jgi:hypothetical protein
MEDIIDLIVTDASPAEISDAIKSSLFTKAGEKIQGLRPDVASSLFDETIEDADNTNYQEEE